MLLEIASRFVRPGAVVWDIGANVGLFAFAAAAHAGEAGRVLAVEPDIWLANLMRRSLQLPENAGLQLEILHAAACDQPGTARFSLAKRSRATSHLSAVRGSTQTGGSLAEELVPAVTLDALLDERGAPDFVKIDVEGAELLVLKGASRMLSSVRPVIYCEVSAECVDGITRLLHERAYRLYDPERDPALQRRLGQAVWNTFALP